MRSFAYQDRQVRVVNLDERPWFVAADLAEVLGYSQTNNMLRMIDENRKGVHLVKTLGGEQPMSIVTEGAMYRCIFGSKRQEAEEFQLWVEDVLLPTLRRTGRFELASVEPIAPELRILPAPSMLETPEDFERFRGAMQMVRLATVAFGLPGARRAWKLSGLPDVSGEAATAVLIQAKGNIAPSLETWLAERTEAVAGHREPTQTLYDDYTAWATEAGWGAAEIVSLGAFGKQLSHCGIASIKTNRMSRIGLKLMAT
jgi:hypothetical protein